MFSVDLDLLDNHTVGFAQRKTCFAAVEGPKPLGKNYLSQKKWPNAYQLKNCKWISESVGGEDLDKKREEEANVDLVNEYTELKEVVARYHNPSDELQMCPC